MSLLVEPKLRFGHSSIVHTNLMYVFGGWDGNVTLNDLNVFNLDTCQWFQLTSVKGQIKGRYRHSATKTETSMFIFGGIDQTQERFNDIHEFQFETQAWARVISTGNPPSPRTFHQSLSYQGQLYVMGGFDGMKRNDMYKILLDNSPSNFVQNAQISAQEEVKEQSSKLEQDYFTEEYFNNLVIQQWVKLKP